MARPLPHADSQRIQWLRFPLMVAVVWIHMGNDRIGLPDPAGGLALWEHWLRKAVSEGLAATAVPLFFLVSGYLFFWGEPLTSVSYGSKLRRRIQTLLIPFLIWNGGLALAIALAAQIPSLHGLVEKPAYAFVHGGALDWAKAIFGFPHAPVVYPFWFLRDLMLVALLAPLWQVLARRAAWLGLGILGVPWFLHAWPLPIPGGVACLFFFVGGCVALRGGSLFAWDRWTPLLGTVYLVLLVLETTGLTGRAYPSVHQVGIGLGVLTVLGVSRWPQGHARVAVRLERWAGSAFFLFAIHEPLLSLLRQAGDKAWGPLAPLADFAWFLVLPTGVVCFALGLHGLLVRVAPRVARIVTGDR